MLTKEVARIILTALSEGNRRETAARLAGIDPSTLSRWMSSEDEPYCSFAIEVDKTEARTEADAVAIVQKARSKSPSWAAWWLERKLAREWGRQQSEVTNDDQAEGDEIDVGTMTDEQLRALAAGDSKAARKR